MRRSVLMLVVAFLLAGWEGHASSPSGAFSPPPASGAPSLHTATTRPEAPTTPPASARPSAGAAEGWEALRRETLPEPVGSPSSLAWRWLLGLFVAIALIRWGLPRALHGGSKGQIAHWLTRLTPPKSEGTITVLDTRFVGAGALHLVAVRGRTLLVGSTAQQVNLLMDLTETGETTSAFDKMLETAKPFQPEPGFDEEAAQTQQTLQQLRARLAEARRRFGA
jgi:flagellar biogenesis protein FliO